MSYEDSEAVKLELRAHTKMYSMLRLAYLSQLYHNGKLSFLELFSRIRDMVSQTSKFYGEQRLNSWDKLTHSFDVHTINVVASILAHNLRLNIELEHI